MPPGWCVAEAIASQLSRLGCFLKHVRWQQSGHVTCTRRQVQAQVVQINDYQKQRFVERVIEAMFNTISDKIITVLGFAFKKVRLSCCTLCCLACQAISGM